MYDPGDLDDIGKSGPKKTLRKPTISYGGTIHISIVDHEIRVTILGDAEQIRLLENWMTSRMDGLDKLEALELPADMSAIVFDDNTGASFSTIAAKVAPGGEFNTSKKKVPK